jgi:hypothetical protein
MADSTRHRKIAAACHNRAARTEWRPSTKKQQDCGLEAEQKDGRIE